MSLFNLKRNLGELKSSNDGVTRLQYDQLAPSREVKGTNFPGKSIHYRFSVGGQRWWLPSRSYFLMRLKLTKPNGADAPVLADDVALAPGAASCLFQSAELRLNGKTVSHISDHLPQIDAVQTRLRKSKSYIESIGKAANLWEPDFRVRQNNQAADGTTLTSSAGPLVATPAHASNDHTTRAEALADINAGLGQLTIASERKNEVELIWQPPLSIFGVSHAMPTGQYEIVLNPQSANAYKLSVVESAGGSVPTTNGANNAYQFEVSEMLLYNAMVEADPMADGTFYLDMEDIRAQVISNVGAATSSTTKNLDVNPSTHSLTVALQDLTAGNATQFPPTKFKAGAQLEQKLTNMRITYAGQTKPSPDWDGAFSGTENFMTQRYWETAAYSGGLFDKGGFETFKEWLDMGPLYYWSWPRDGRDMGSTRVDITFKASADISASQLIVFDHYRSVARITIQNSQIIDVQMESV